MSVENSTPLPIEATMPPAEDATELLDQLTSEDLKGIMVFAEQMAYNRIGSKSFQGKDAGDLVGAAMEALCTALKYNPESLNFDDTNGIKRWLTGVLRHKVADLYRGEARARENRLVSVEEFPEHISPALVAPDSAKEAIESISLESLFDELNGLSDSKKILAFHAMFPGASSEEIAEQLGTTSGSMRVGKHRFLRSMREQLSASSDPSPQ